MSRNKRWAYCYTLDKFPDFLLHRKKPQLYFVRPGNRTTKSERSTGQMCNIVWMLIIITWGSIFFILSTAITLTLNWRYLANKIKKKNHDLIFSPKWSSSLTFTKKAFIFNVEIRAPTLWLATICINHCFTTTSNYELIADEI